MQLLQATNLPGLTIYAIIKQKWEAKYWDAGAETPALVEEPTSPALILSEDTVIKGLYQVVIATILPNGRYLVAVYKQSGETPSPADDGEPDVVEIEVKNGYIYVVR
jgi:hypothetical protein